jgi:hypothetical protein
MLQTWLPSHDMLVLQAYKERIMWAVKSIDELFLAKATPFIKRGEPDQWIIAKQDWNKIVAAILKELEG